MADKPQQPPRNVRAKGKTPAERSEEFAEAQRKLKEEAAERRKAAAESGEKRRRG